MIPCGDHSKYLNSIITVKCCLNKIFFILAYTTSMMSCGDPPIYLNSIITVQKDMDTIYSCAPGFQTHIAHARCHSGKWSEVSMDCAGKFLL